MTNDKVVVYRKDYQPPNVEILLVDLDICLAPLHTRVRADLHIKKIADGPLFLHGQDLDLKSIAINNAPLDASAYTHDDKGLIILSPDDEFHLQTEVVITPARNTHLEGIYQSDGIYTTQCEPEGFRRITFMLDRPDISAGYQVKITIEDPNIGDDFVILSNGNPGTTGRDALGRRFAFWHDPFPKPTYLFALVVGDMAVLEDQFITEDGRAIGLYIFFPPNMPNRADYAMDALKRSMRWDETRFGLQYDLERFHIVAIDEFNMGAMENKSLNIFNAKYLLVDPDSATDDDYGFVESIVAHEYFHNWTGNRVTCRDWFQLSLKEGLTVFRDQEFTSDQRSRSLKRIEDVQLLKRRQFPEDAGPFSHPVRPDEYHEMNNFYTATVYEKGAEIVRMVHTMLGEEYFMQGMRNYIAKHDGKAATIEDFLQAMDLASDHDVMSFLPWYANAGTPSIHARHEYIDGALHLHLSQTQNGKPSVLPVPLALALLDEDGEHSRMRCRHRLSPCGDGAIFVLRQSNDTLVFDGADDDVCVSLNRYFSAPVIVDYPQATAQNARLIAHESDAFCAWQSLQEMLHDILATAIEAVRNDAAMPDAEAFLRAFWSVQDQNNPDHAFLAQCMEIPGVGELIDLCDSVSLGAIVTARRWLIGKIADRYAAQLLAKHQSITAGYDNDITAPIAGLRALRNSYLRILCANDDKKSIKVAEKQALNAKNMTDHIAALGMLNEADEDVRTPLMQAFYDRWRDDSIVIDKWVSLQAQSWRHCDVERVYALCEDPVFSFSKPNRVRALLHGFCVGNPKNFHSQAGYDLFVDMCHKTDKINPSVAARFAGVLHNWRKFDDPNRAMMQTSLQKLHDIADLSVGLREMVEKSLSK